MEIRKAKKEDVESIYTFICDLEKTTFNYTVFQQLFFKNIAHPNYLYLVAESKDRIIGYLSCHAQILLHHCGTIGEIQELYIEPSARNKGIGQLLIAEIEAFAKIEKWVGLEVTCNKKRIDTHRFYQRLGFLATHLKFVKEIK